MANNRPMTEDEKKLLQTQHRMDAKRMGAKLSERTKSKNQTIDPDWSRIGERIPRGSDHGA